MNPNSNPFAPGAGFPPPELAGRSDILDQALLALARTRKGRSEKSIIMVGLRGVGKTVLLNEISQLAENDGYMTIMVEAQEKKRLAALLYPQIRQTLFSLGAGPRVSEKVRRGLSVLRSFIGALNVKIGDVEFGLDVEPERGTADSGDLTADLSEVIVALAEAARDRETAIAIMVDELQYLNEIELSSLIVAIHRVSQRALPLILIGAGLPQLVAKTGEAKSYAERLFSFPELGPLKREDAIRALREPARKENADFTEDGLEELINLTHGYPYFLQEWGYQSWNIAETPLIGINDIRKATASATAKLDESFFRVRFDRLTPREKVYLRALAELGDKPQRSGDIAEKLGVGASKVGPLRNKLINKGMIYSPAHGDTAFTVPLFDDYLKRIMPYPAARKQ